MSQQTINVGTSPNDGTGTPLRTAFQYTNSNFSELYTALGGGSGLPGATTQVIFNDGGTNLAGDAGLVYNKTTDALTIGGNVQAASATITGDLTVRTTGLTVNSSGVGVGTSSQSSFLGNSPKKLVIGDGTQTPALTLYGGTANVSGIYYAKGTVGNEAYRGFIEYNHAVDALTVGISGSTAMTLNGNGALALQGGNTSANGVGITFPATQVASSDANTLDDYEESTWSPTITAGSGTPTTVTVNSASYTKIGRVVVAQVDFTIVNKGTATTSLLFTLPFTSASLNQCGAFRETFNTGNMGQIYSSGNTTQAAMQFYGNTTVWADTNRIAGTFTYFAA